MRQDVGDCPLLVAQCIVGDTRLSRRGLQCLNRCWDRRRRGLQIVVWLRKWFNWDARLFPSRSNRSAPPGCRQLIQDLLFGRGFQLVPLICRHTCADL